VDIMLLKPSRMTPKRFRIYHADIGEKPGMFQAAFATTAEVVAFSYEAEKEYRILVDHRKSYSIDEFKALVAKNEFDIGGRP
jgi:hypothetical protein